MILPPKELKIRSDAGGDGHYGASRWKRVNGHKVYYPHRGIDLRVTPGEDIIAGERLKILRISRPYVTDKNYSGLACEIPGLLEFKVFYIAPMIHLVGKTVDKDTIIGVAQNISRKYEKVTPHIHFEITCCNPALLFGGKDND